ncbi:hypothetical protein BRC90_01565 [Halobacteriales archaeon QS_4_69_34]|nr:MAG: hypothetical protein BRC90_01565 [Halobacteriales archaeon QS_4_69_34]
MRSIASVVVYGCEYEQLQANNESCHVEEPAPHVHPPSAPSSTAEVLNAMDDAAAPGTAKQAVVDDLRGYYEQVNGSAS